MMRFRRRDSLDVEGLSDADLARLESFLRHPCSRIPGLEGLESHGESNSPRAGDPAPTTERGPIRSTDVLPRKRGRRS